MIISEPTITLLLSSSLPSLSDFFFPFPSHLFTPLRRFEPSVHRAALWLPPPPLSPANVTGNDVRLAFIFFVIFFFLLLLLETASQSQDSIISFKQNKVRQRQLWTSREREAASLSSANHSANTFEVVTCLWKIVARKLPVWGMKEESDSCQLLTSIWERSVGVWGQLLLQTLLLCLINGTESFSSTWLNRAEKETEKKTQAETEVQHFRLKIRVAGVRYRAARPAQGHFSKVD